MHTSEIFFVRQNLLQVSTPNAYILNTKCLTAVLFVCITLIPCIFN